MMIKRELTLLAMLLGGIAGLHSQNDDFGLWTSTEVKKKIFPGFEASAEGEFRLRDQWKKVDRWSGSVGVDYELFPFLKIGAGYTYIYYNHPAETTKKGNYIPEYGSPRHRFDILLTGRYSWQRFRFSLREKYQFTHRVGLSVPKYDLEKMKQKDDEIVSSKSMNILRSRFQAEYNIKKSPFIPYASCELYHSLDGEGFKKMRWTLGSSYKLGKKNTFDLYYLYQNEADEDETDGHVLGIGYSFKF